MQTLSLRQLKYQKPSAIHTAAEAYAMAMYIALDRLGLSVTTAVRSGLALSLFQAGSISIGSVAQIA